MEREREREREGGGGEIDFVFVCVCVRRRYRISISDKAKKVSSKCKPVINTNIKMTIVHWSFCRPFLSWSPGSSSDFMFSGLLFYCCLFAPGSS